MAYPEKRDGVVTGHWYGEVDNRKKGGKRFRRRFESKKLAEGYEVYVGLMGVEPPTVDNAASTGHTFAAVADECKQAGGPRGKWKRERDGSVLQRLDYCIGIIGHYDIAAVNTAVLDLIVTDLQKRPALGKEHKLTNGTINRYLSAASAVLHFALDREYIGRKPKVPLQHEINKRQGVLTNFDQEDAILRVLEGRGELIVAECIRVLVETGIRESELLEELRRDQIEIETLPDQSENGWLNFAGDQTKNTEDRRVYIRPELARKLRALLAKNALPKASHLLRMFKWAVKTCGYADNLVIHSLRHTRNTRLRKLGVDMKIRMKMLGHKTVAASMRYDHVDTDDQLAAAKKVENIRGDGRQSAEVVKFPGSEIA